MSKKEAQAMSEVDGAQPQETAALLDAILTPYRSLSKPGFRVLMLLIGLVSFGLGAFFFSIGAWPVFGFFFLDVLLVYFAFRVSYRSGREYETVHLTPQRLTVTHIDPDGRSQSFDFNPFWVRVHLSERADGRTRIALASHGQELVFGKFLTDDERKEFAGALNDALGLARAARL
ncbi:MAG: DUF2244 domain-containing protein [Hyphomicrobiaceae bacterium]|nr:DUF2244 domain-containing protein [Hyphomicrobiaceae bacterium]